MEKKQKKVIKVLNKTVEFDYFDMDDMVEHASIIMIAKRASGKSWICRDIIRTKKDIPCGVVISPTEKMSDFYKFFFPDLFIHHEYTSDLMVKIRERQEKMIQKEKEKAKHKPVDPRALLLMDDCLASKGSWAKDPEITAVLMNGRHYKLTYMLTMQFPLGISPELRSNFDYIFLLGDDIASNQKRLYDHYAGMFPSFNIFKEVFIQLTADYGCMVINNRVKSHEINKKVFFYKANPSSDFKFGSNQFNLFHKNLYDAKYRDRKSININDLSIRKRR